MVLAIVGLVALILIAKGILPFQMTKEKLCETSNRWSSWFGEGGPAGLGIAGSLKTANPIGGSFCSATNVEFDAKDWTTCDPEFKSKFMATSDEDERTKWAKHCAAQQVMEHVLSCYGLGGAGKWEPDSFVCYTFAIRGEDEEFETEDELKAYQQKVIKAVGAGMSAKGELLSTNVLNEIGRLARERQLYLMLVNHYKDRIWAGIDQCKANDEVDALNLTNLIIESPADVASILSGNINPTKVDKVNDIESDDGINCGQLNQNIAEHWTKIEKYNASANSVDAELVRVSDEAGVPEGTITKDSLGELAGDVNQIKFDEDFLMELASTTKVLGRDITYEQALHSLDNFEVLHGYEIKMGTLYEIGFCNPPLKIGSGLGARFMCNYAHAQMVQVAVGGTGAGGQLRTGSPYPGYCHSFGSVGGLKIDIGILDAPRKWCENMMEGIFGPSAV
ncbi:MAG: hypothetical protein CL675_14185 [Bdellovibrionaceae bacterium]|nr:hypothetical protein [Pseudobdellovibrionaceae bacterium]